MAQSKGKKKNTINIPHEEDFDSPDNIDTLPIKVLTHGQGSSTAMAQNKGKKKKPKNIPCEEDCDSPDNIDTLPINVLTQAEDCFGADGGSSGRNRKKSRPNRGKLAAALATEFQHSLSDGQECKGANNDEDNNVDSQGENKFQKSNRVNKNPSASKPGSSSQEDSILEDEMIKQFTLLNRTCAFANCKGIITMIFFDCKLCCKRYCIPHSLPEVHGCGTDAKRAAKKDFVHPIPKELNSKAKRDLEKKLTHKLSALSKERKGGNQKSKPK